MGKLDDARQTCESARTLDASSTPIVLELAKIARLQKDYAASQEFLRQILLLQPGFRPALQEYAMLEVNRGNFAQALEWQIKSVRGDPAPQVVDLNVLGFLFVRVGDDRRAESVYAASLIQAPYDFGAHFRLGEIYLRGKRWEEASRQLEAVVRYYPTERPEPYADLAQAYFNLQRPHDAESTLDKGQRLFPGDISLSHTPVVQ
jgi:tetratricopeptide (TPR) repeat protein